MDMFSNLYYTDSGNKGYFPNIAESDVTRGSWTDKYNGDYYMGQQFTADPTGNSMYWTDPIAAAQKYGSIWDNMFDQNSNFNWTPREGSDNLWNLMVKSGDKEGSQVAYGLKDGYYQPIEGSQASQYWDTNSSFQNSSLLKMLALAVGANMIPSGGPVPGTETAGATLGGTGGSLPAGFDSMGQLLQGASTTGGTPLVNGIGTGFGGVGATTGTMGSILPTSAAVGGLGAIPGVGTALDMGGIANYLGGPGAGMPTGGGAPPTGGGSGTQSPSILDSIKQLFGGGGSGGTGGTGGTGTGGQNFSNLANLLSAWYSRNAMSGYSDEMRNLATAMQNQANPYMQKLEQSYTDPNAYFNSPDVKARLELESNRLTGIDAQKSRLSNPIERDMLLQKYSAKDIGDYRSGLQNSIRSVYTPDSIAKLYGTAFANDAAKNSALVGATGNWLAGGGAGQNTNVWDQISGAIDAGEDIWDSISSWFD